MKDIEIIIIILSVAALAPTYLCIYIIIDLIRDFFSKPKITNYEESLNSKIPNVRNGYIEESEEDKK